MKKFLKKNKKTLVTLLVLSFVLVAVVVAVKSIQIFSPSASNLASNRMINVSVQGAVAIEDSNSEGANRFTKLNCPKKPFKTSRDMDVATTFMDRTIKAGWDCNEPNFFFRQVKAQQGKYTFKLTPPQGYSCSRSYAYIAPTSDIYVDIDNSCSLELQIDQKHNSIFIWYKVVKIPVL